MFGVYMWSSQIHGIKICFWLTLTMSVSSVESSTWNCAPFEFHLEDFPLNFQSLQWLNTYTIRSAGMFKFNHTVSRTVVTSRHYPVDVDAVCMRGNRIMMNGVLLTQEWDTMSGRRVLWQTHKPRCTSCFFFLFLSCHKHCHCNAACAFCNWAFLREKRSKKEKEKEKKKERRRTRNGREKGKQKGSETGWHVDTFRGTAPLWPCFSFTDYGVPRRGTDMLGKVIELAS